MEEASRVSTQSAVTGWQVDEMMKRLKICPREVLGSLGNLRIDRPRISPIESKDLKRGGNADVEAAILVPTEPSNSSELDHPVYVAVKKLRFDTETDDDRTLAPFAHEVNLLNDLSHDNVVKIIGFVEDVRQGVAWMVFLWEKNGNLREFIRSESWELPERVSLLDDVAGGLRYLHGRNPPICHGDLKSVSGLDMVFCSELGLTPMQLNILVNSGNRAVITDFGSARAMDSATGGRLKGADKSEWATGQHDNVTGVSKMDSLKAEVAASGNLITMTGPVWTIRWAAPELLEGEPPGLESDIWAFGWICWEDQPTPVAQAASRSLKAITGNFPFDKDNDVAVVRRIVTKDLPPISNNTQLQEIKILCSLMEDCLRLDANERPSAMRCQQVVSLMDQVVPLRRSGGSLATTRSSGLLYALGRIQLRNGVMAGALEYFRQSLEVGKSAGDEQSQARALSAIGDVYRMQDEYSKAEDFYIQAREIYSQIGNQLGYAQSVKSLGDVYYMRDEYSKAEQSYMQARDIYSQVADQHGFAQSVKSLGDVFRMRNEYSYAE
ncbi:hypothetical protein FS837_004641 [Tulasnella sp. UAMH 9824]|nr:hypothetical protein FS837_004641 [Tulasnella sp. UAMH 9824]